ncbi:MAG: hypothetical protein HY720_31875, partial [Planctomycetes bacterium]|nr:hypothetical protein [Planctomycetota bacterium]
MRASVASRFASDPELAAIAPVRAAPRAELPEDVAVVRLSRGWAFFSRRAFRVEWSGPDLVSLDSFPVRARVSWILRWAEEDPASIARHFQGEGNSPLPLPAAGTLRSGRSHVRAFVEPVLPPTPAPSS